MPKITSADFRSKSSKPWKPEVNPPRRRGGFNRGRGGRQFDNVQRNERFKNSENNGNQNGDNRETILEILEVEDKVEEILEAI